MEGMGLFIMKKVKKLFLTNFKTKLAALLCKKNVSALRRELDTSEYGGAPFLGINAPVIKAHGSSDARAIKNAVRQAITCCETNIVGELTKIFQTIDSAASAE
jgi:glycerol-3-phosphate acyltransferase PlsX